MDIQGSGDSKSVDRRAGTGNDDGQAFTGGAAASGRADCMRNGGDCTLFGGSVGVI